MGILSPRGEEIITFYRSGFSYKGLKLTFPSPLGERMSEGQVRGQTLCAS